jgi:hypothetical protein
MDRYKIALETVIGKDFGPDGKMHTFEYKQGKVTDLETFNEYEIMLEPMTAILDYATEQKNKLAEYESLGTVAEIQSIITNSNTLLGAFQEYENMFGPLAEARKLYSEESDYPATEKQEGDTGMKVGELSGESKTETSSVEDVEQNVSKSNKKGLLG